MPVTRKMFVKMLDYNEKGLEEKNNRTISLYPFQYS